MDAPLTPDTPQAAATPAPGAPEGQQEVEHEAITQPAKLLRIATMVRELLEDTRQASLDEPGRIRLRQIYERAIGELEDVLSPDLQEELSSLAPPMQGVPTDAEIRVAQAQLVGWLEGLFHGIQAALFAQQMAARQQFEELRRRGLPGGAPVPADPSGQTPDTGRGPYL
jgi:Bacterial proteasome activator